MTDPDTVLEIRDVTKSYGGVKALDSISLSVNRGEFVALIGANGAGKTTLLQLLVGLFAPDSGSISVLGHDLRHHTSRALSGIGVVFQQPTLDLELSIRANLTYHADLHGMPRRVARERIGWALDRFGRLPGRHSDNVFQRRAEIENLRHDVAHILHPAIHAAGMEIGRDGVGRETFFISRNGDAPGEAAAAMANVK